MTTVTTMPLSGDWTVDDLDHLPDDGLRYELVDGVLLVSPSPAARHQLALSALLVQLSNAAPPELRVLAAPLDITFSPTRQLQPDIVVLHAHQLAAAKVAGLPVLAVEVLSSGTRATDMTLKRHVLEQAGVASYWLLDCEVPYLTVLELVDGAYQDVAHVQGAEVYQAQRPFPVRIVPLDLLR